MPISYQAFVIISLILSLVNFISLPIIIGKLFFSQREITYMPADEYGRIFGSGSSEELAKGAEVDDDEEDEFVDAPNLSALFSKLEEAERNQEYKNEIFPEGN